VTLGEQITLPGVSDDDQRTLNLLLERLRGRQERNLLRASYYDGKRAIRDVGGIIPPQYYKLGIVLGWSAKAVDLLARRCNLEGFVWPDGNLDDLGGSVIWDDNMLGSEIDSALVSSLTHGPAFLVNTIGDEAAGETRSLIHVKDALSAAGEWNPRRRGLDSLLSITDRDEDQVTGLVLYLDGVTITADRRDGKWETDRQEHDYGVPAEVLPYRPTVRRPFGSSRITRPIMALQDRATKSVVRLEAHSDIYAIPDLWMLGADETIFKNSDGSQKASWQVMMGRIKGIPDDDDAPTELARADIKQFPAASPSPHLATLNALAKMFAREASLPDTAVAITDVSNPTSAESYDASQYELIAEAEGATTDWTPALRRSMVRALAILNSEPEVPEAWRSIDAKWRDPRYLAKSAQADAGLKQLQAAPWLAETEVGLELLGLTDQQIKRALAERRRQSGSAAMASILDRLAPVEDEADAEVTDDVDPEPAA
jgi:hypothetical protein